MKIYTRKMCTVMAVGAVSIVSTAGASLADQASCKNSACTIPVISGAKCALSAYTNAADTWTLSASNNADGSAPFNTQEGFGEDNTPMKWTSGSGVFNSAGEYVYISFAAKNGGKGLQIHTGSGFADGTSSAIMNGEDGADTDFNDVIANVTCIK